VISLSVPRVSDVPRSCGVETPPWAMTAPEGMNWPMMYRMHDFVNATFTVSVSVLRFLICGEGKETRSRLKMELMHAAVPLQLLRIANAYRPS
jgi:hypothetical protein